ncbi:hypothetical protein L21_2714 [Methanoculleus chikugoensis]|uniref:Uncharacterized protein n=1 Tax=Methanoculleus chikugoensis TaxID=118126 RepID=A0A1M4MP99_9EURY|nr:hypothetical protein L21_2714 [Methanoculleus chikugoensis]
MAVEIIADRDTRDAFVDDSPSPLLFHKWDFLTITGQHTEANNPTPINRPPIKKRFASCIDRTGGCSPGAAEPPGRSKTVRAPAPGSVPGRYKYAL